MNSFIKSANVGCLVLVALVTGSPLALSNTANCPDPRVSKEISFQGSPVCICDEGSQGCGGISEVECPKGLYRSDNLVATTGSNIVYNAPGVPPTGKICIYSKRPTAYYAMVILKPTCKPGQVETLMSGVKYCCPTTATNGSICCSKQ